MSPASGRSGQPLRLTPATNGSGRATVLLISTWPLLGGGQDRAHDVQGVEHQLGAGAVGPAGANGIGHVGHAQAAAVLGIAVV